MMVQEVEISGEGSVAREKVLVQLVGQVCRVHKVVNEMGGEVAARHDLFVGELDVVNLLGRTPGLRMGDVAHRLSISPPNATRIVKPLEEKRLVWRSRAENSDREVIARLTDEGFSVHERCSPQIVGEAKALFDTALSPEEQSVLLSLLQKLDGCSPI